MPLDSVPPPPCSVVGVGSLATLQVRYQSPAEQEELLLQLLAAKDAAGTPSPDTAASESPSEEAVNAAAVPLLEAEEDF